MHFYAIFIVVADPVEAACTEVLVLECFIVLVVNTVHGLESNATSSVVHVSMT